jgi:hypothetical protein
MSVFSSEMSVDFPWTTGCYISEDRHLNKGEIRDGDEDVKGIKQKKKKLFCWSSLAGRKFETA